MAAACVLVAVSTSSAADAVQPLPQAHAHNDYAHRRPLLDALEHGFCNVEADVFLVGDALLVAHNAIDLRPGRSLQALYLDPLRARVKANGGKVYRDGPAFTLMIDLKTDAEKTYAALAKALAEYADIVTVVRDGKVEAKAVSVVLSGNRPTKTVAAEKVRYVGIDGRLSDLKSDAPPHLMPWLSDNWTGHFRWRGVGAMPEEERKKLREIVAEARHRGRKVRFWATPDRKEVWQELHAAGVDLINTDDLAGLRGFLNAHRKQQPGAE